MKNKKTRYDVFRKILIFWCLFVGVGAFFGGVAMLIEPDGSLLQMQNMLPYFKKLPFADVLFKDYVFSGIALICVNGLTNVIASVLLFKNKKSGVVCGLTFGVTLALWICIQFYMFPANVLSTLYFVFGLLQAVTGYVALVSYKQNQFSLNVDDYTNIGADKSQLVVYFSRMGYTKKIAYQTANQLGADVYQITTSQPTSGTGGFWWCGYFGMRGKDMPIDDVKVNLLQYDHVTICAPIWVFNLCSPMQTFCKQAKGKVKSVSYVILHHTKARYAKVFDKMDAMLGLKRKDAVSICCKMGNYKRLKQK